MGKATKQLTRISDKSVRSELKKHQLQKVSKQSGGLIKKQKDKLKEQQKNDLDELRALLKLDGDQAGGLMTDNQQDKMEIIQKAKQ